MSFFYTPEALYNSAESYGESGRAAYVRARFTFDLLWPLVYTLFLTTAISWITSWEFSLDSIWQYANLTPIVGMFLDYMENIATSIVMLRYPSKILIAAWLAPIFTSLKWITITASFLLLMLLGVYALWKVLKVGRG
jgi:hypothetical protein